MSFYTEQVNSLHHRNVENIPNCPLQEHALCPVEVTSPRELGPVAPRKNIQGDMVIARSRRLGNQPILSIPADRIHVLRGGQIACSRHWSHVDAGPNDQAGIAAPGDQMTGHVYIACCFSTKFTVTLLKISLI